MAASIVIRSIQNTDKDWIKQVMLDAWGSEIVIASESFNTLRLPGFIAELDSRLAGVATYNISNGRCEIVSLNSIIERKGVGTALVDGITRFAKEKKYKSVWLVTSNDNIDALKFYQKHGFRITKIYPDAIDKARKLKPQIPLIGDYGIPMKDAIKLELFLKPF